MNSNLGGGGSRSQKMLSMVGLRLKKVSDCSRPQWKVCSPSTVVNAELNVSYEVSNFESEVDVLEEPIINNLENESTMQESDRPVATESGEPQPKVSYEVSSFEYKDISEEPVNKTLKNEQTMSELDMPVATESGKPQPKVNYEVSNFDSEVVFAEPVINELENGHTMHELDMRVATESGEPQPKVLNPIIITDLPNYEASSFEPQVILPELVSSLSERNVSNGKVSQLESSSSNSSDSEEAFSSDDSVQDPNYSSDSSSSSGSSSENDENIIEMTGERKKTRKRKAVPSEWKKNCAKRLRNSGKSYTTLGKGLLMPERQLKPPCNDKCKLICSNKFTEEERLSIFENYWKMTDIVKQRTYILTLIQEINPKYRYTRQVNGRATNHAFYFFNDNKKIRVCKHFFIATLGITNRCIRTVKAKIKNNTLGEDNRGKHANHKEVSREIKDGVRSHISSIPTIESHYTRADSEKVYIEGSKTIAQLHRDYRSECEAQGIPYANLTMYRNIFNNEYNIAFFVPKKDQCQTCVSYQNSNEDEKKASEIEYNCHIEEKNLSRAEKTRDKNRISPLFQVACFDLEASLPTPNGQVSSFYYRSKLSTYNFTVCDITQKGQGPVNCYMWHEAEGKRGANEIGTCLLNYLKEKAEASNSNELEITLYSDNCAGQQKNKFVITAFLYAVTNYNIKSITHKYLVTGHTQNEGDNVHSLIEKNIKRALKSSPIYTPSQYVGLVQTAKKTGYPFKVVELAYSDFLDLKNLTEQTCSNFNKNSLGENFKLSDMSILKVEKENLGRFFYKTSFKDTDYKVVNVINERRTRTPFIVRGLLGFQFKKAYTKAIPITKKKYDDLMFLLRTNAITKNHSHFYENLTFQ